MKTYEYILLDWDGNLAKTLDIWLDACRTVLHQHGLDLLDQEITAGFGSFPQYFKNFGITDIHVVFEQIDKRVKESLPEVDLYPGALEVLYELHESGKKLALITTSTHQNVHHLLQKHGMLGLFAAIVTANDTTKHKPDPEPLELALELLGGNKESAVMIGDSDKDILAATNTSVDSILFFPPEHAKFYDRSKLTALNPTYTVSDFRQILNII